MKLRVKKDIFAQIAQIAQITQITGDRW